MSPGADKFRWVVERLGHRGARMALASTGVVFMALIAVWAVTEIMAAWRGNLSLKVLLAVLIAVLLLLLSWRILLLNWRATRATEDRPDPTADSGEQSGIWGVGGPSMREPGSTGAWPIRRGDRRYQEDED